MKAGSTPTEKVLLAPSAGRLMGSLRDIGYDFQTSIADLVDNSISAGATEIDVVIGLDDRSPMVTIADNGAGMSERTLLEALRFGSRRAYGRTDLGRYGLGLKTASLAHCRRLTVATRTAPKTRRILAYRLDLETVERTDEWAVLNVPVGELPGRVVGSLDRPGTVVVWEALDRLLPYQREAGGWARRRAEQLAMRAARYLAMVFHRFIEGTAAGHERLTITVNGEKLIPWSPFAEDESATIRLPASRFEVPSREGSGTVVLRPFVLPPRGQFSSPAAFERLSGPNKWNRQQGLYIYRNDRMIQAGGWCGLRVGDEHTKLARAALDFDAGLDEVFRINVPKMRVLIPSELRPMLEGPVHDVCHRAEMVYRRDVDHQPDQPARTTSTDFTAAVLALRAAALDTGTWDALEQMFGYLKERHPEMAASLGI